MSESTTRLRQKLEDDPEALAKLQNQCTEKGHEQVGACVAKYVAFLKEEDNDETRTLAAGIFTDLTEDDNQQLLKDRDSQTRKADELQRLMNGYDNGDVNNMSAIERLLDGIFNGIVRQYNLGAG